MKLAVVVQRYGAGVNGGAELHARYIAELLARHAEVEVLTTCALDYITWKNELPAGPDQVNGVRVLRFPVVRPRDPDDFGRHSRRVFHERHSLADELAWLDSEGPRSPALIRCLARSGSGYDFCVFFSYRYYHSYHGTRLLPDRSILVPTAERDPAIGLGVFRPMFRRVRALMYNSPEERALIEAVSGNRNIPGVVVGIGSMIPDAVDPARFRRKHGITERFAIYVGRIDENKGCRALFSSFTDYAQATPGGISLVLVGNAVLPVPSHPRIRHLGFLDDRDKFDAIAASELLIMPSQYESLSMVALEAWALGKPVLANGRCDVLRGQAIRSNAGLYYDGHREFVECLYRMETDERLRRALGENGRLFYRRNYDWPVIESKYLGMIEELRREGGRRKDPQPAAEDLPGWFARRRRTERPAEMVLSDLPSGPVLEEPRHSAPLAARSSDLGRQSSPGAAGRTQSSVLSPQSSQDRA
ncbi:MAG: glycosyltransferase family 4 protein [Vicinamibacterales bacterium]